MNGVHDMGGMQDFGPIQPEKNEPVFHESWEGRVLAMGRALGAIELFEYRTQITDFRQEGGPSGQDPFAQASSAQPSLPSSPFPCGDRAIRSLSSSARLTAHHRDL